MLPKFSLEPQPRMATVESVDPTPRARQECRAVCETLRERLTRGTLPPEEAYWWTRIAVEEAVR